MIGQKIETFALAGEGLVLTQSIGLLITKSTHRARNILERRGKHLFRERLYGGMQFVVLFLPGIGDAGSVFAH